MGFIYACYVVKLISEEEDSCKYADTRFSTDLPHRLQQSCRRLRTPVTPCAAVHHRCCVRVDVVRWQDRDSVESVRDLPLI